MADPIKRFTVLRDSHDAKAGETLYEFCGCDYGCAGDDTRTSGIQHIAITRDANGNEPFLTVPKRDLQEIGLRIVSEPTPGGGEREAEREAFESMMRRDFSGIDLRRESGDSQLPYRDPRANTGWHAWQAARLAPAVTLTSEEIAAIRDVAAERTRQIEVEGWTAAHDDEHGGGQLAKAAACYATGSTHTRSEQIHHDGLPTRATKWISLWPWDLEWWKPSDRRRNLVKAGALILAEIERLDRITVAKS